MSEATQLSEAAPETRIEPPPGQSATRVRWVALAFLCGLSAVLYIDRICFSKAVPTIRSELGISSERISLVMVAFTIAYGIFEIPVGRWGDRIGPRRVLPRIAVCWSFFTALTGACFGFWQLLVVRFLFGMGEAGAFPNTARVLARWFPDRERARAQGFLLAASQVGLIVAMPVAGYLLEWFGWRWMFLTFGVLGVVWAIAFHAWFRDDPAAHPAVNASEREWIGSSRAVPVSKHDPIPWELVLRNRSIWALCGTMICGSFNSYFYFSWFPSYLEQARQVANLESGWLTSTLYLGGALGMLCGGLLTGRSFRQAAHRDRAIRMQGALVFATASACLWLAAHSQQVWALAPLTALSYACAQSSNPLFWSCTIHISGRHVGAIFGLINMSGMLGAAASQYFVGAYIGRREALGLKGRELWDPVFIVYELMLLVGSICWSLYRTRLLEPDHAGSGEPNPDS